MNMFALVVNLEKCGHPSLREKLTKKSYKLDLSLLDSIDSIVHQIIE